MTQETKEGSTVERRVHHRMGAWKWGYPRGQRLAIVRYIARADKGGMLRWYRHEELCDGLTAANVETWQAHCPEAFEHGVGSLHRVACS